MNSTPGSTLVIGDGKCWMHGQKYMGKYLSFKLVGASHDPYPEYTFEHGTVSGLGLKFTEVPSCKAPTSKPVASNSGCYDALLEGGKYVCPACKSVEGGSLRIISHRWDCPKNRHEYCQKKKGGNRRRATKRIRRNNRQSRRK